MPNYEGDGTVIQFESNLDFCIKNYDATHKDGMHAGKSLL